MFPRQRQCCEDILDPFGSGGEGGGCDPTDPTCIVLPPVIYIGGPTIIEESGVGADAASVDNSLRFVGDILAGLKSILNGVLSLIAGIIGLLGQIWNNWIKPALQALQKAFKWLHDKLAPILKRIRDWQNAQRKLLLDLYNKFIRPIIVVIQTIRNIIHLLDLLHIHILDALDRELAKIQALILKPFYLALYRLNTLGSLWGYTLNSYGLIFRSLYLATLTANRGGAFGILASAPAYGFTQLPFTATTAPGTPIVADNFQSASAAVIAAAPDMSVRFAGTPAQNLVACWAQPIGNVDVSTAIDNMIKCMTSPLPSPPELTHG